jgi:hypothetical protein
MEKIELRAAQRFIDNKGVPQEKPKPPDKSWICCYGPYEMPDVEFDACLSVSLPNSKTCLPGVYYSVESFVKGSERPRWSAQTEDGRWLELIDPE